MANTAAKITSNFILHNNALLIIPLSICLYLLSDDGALSLPQKEQHHNLGFITALNLHKPSERVFRGLSEIALILYGTAFALKIWKHVFGDDLVGELLFLPSSAGSDDRAFDAEEVADYELVPVTETKIASSNGDENHPDDEIDGENAIDSQERNTDDEEETNEEGHVSSQYIPIVTPSPSFVANAATNLLLMILLALLLFTMSTFSDRSSRLPTSSTALSISSIAAPVFPLLLFFVSTYLAFFPWHKRKGFWLTVFRTIEAPLHDITFRDGFIGDILTSSVRPMQDVAYTLFYLCSGLQGWWSSQYSLSDADAPLERSWLLHTVVIPACMISPLWYRFLQTLRQAHDKKRRWPYLGNSLKYFVAAQVAIYGVYFPGSKKSVVWMVCFVGATLYQIWWDTFMDWELVTFDKGDDLGFTSFSLRKNRYYARKSVYYFIFGINFMLRFCWTLSFIPTQTLSRAGILTDTFSGGLNATLACAEIIRRTLWGLLRFELEAINKADNSKSVAPEVRDHLDNTLEEYDDMRPMSMGSETSSDFNGVGGVTFFQSDMSGLSEIVIMGELCLYATAFMGLGIIAAAHKE